MFSYHNLCSMAKCVLIFMFLLPCASCYTSIPFEQNWYRNIKVARLCNEGMVTFVFMTSQCRVCTQMPMKTWTATFLTFLALSSLNDNMWCCFLRFYGKLLQSLMDCDEDTVDRIRTSMVSRLGPEMAMLIQLLQNKPCPSTAVAAAAAIPTGVEARGSWRWSTGPHMYKIQPNLRNRESPSGFGKRRSASDGS